MSGKLVKGLVATAVLAALTGCGSDTKSEVKPETKFELTIAHINDTHSNFDAHDLDFTAQVNAADFKVRTSAGGYPRITKKLKALRQDAEDKNRPFLALHGGDAFQGSLYFSLLKGQGNATLMNEMGIDGMAVGNHEFDFGNEPLIDFIEKINFPLLAANMDTSADKKMNALDNLLPYTIKEFDGVKVGIFGLVLEDLETISSPGKDLKFKKEVESAQLTVDTLTSKGVDKVVMVSHIGLTRDIAVAEGVNGVDVIVGGHSHTLLGDFENLGLGKSNVSYAQMFTNPNGKTKTCVVQAGQYAEAVGKLDVAFKNGEITSCNGGNTLLIANDFKHKYDGKKRVALNSEDQIKTEEFVSKQTNVEIAAEDSVVRDIIDGVYKPKVAEFEGTVIGQVNDANDPTDVRSLDHVRVPGVKRSPDGASLPTTGSEAGAQVATSMVWKLNNHNMNVDMAITNNGGVRDHIRASEKGLTAGYIVGTLLYFNNKISIVTLSGENVKKLLETSINYALEKSDGAFPTFANVQFTYNGKADEGSRIEELQVCPEGVVKGNCEAINLTKNYRIATNSYIASGKDGYTVFKENKIGDIENSGFIDNQVMIEYVKNLTEQNQKLEEVPTGLTFIPTDAYESKLDNPVSKPQDNR
ncbi:MAG: bifunctional metallophosphatase/5'-nucleotidase [Parashewanella sp.]